MLSLLKDKSLRIKRFYIATIILCITLIIGGCNKEEKHIINIKNNAEIVLISSQGFYISADQDQNNQLIANRNSIGEWEKFSIEFIENNKVALRTSNFFYVGFQQDNEDLLVGKYPKIESNCTFTIVALDSGKIAFQNSNNKYICIDSNDLLSACSENISDAHLFFIKETRSNNVSHFSFNQLIPLIIGLLFLFYSLIIFQYKPDKKSSIVFLLLGGFCVRLFVGLLNPYLNLWDEQFHALVAKNMIDNFFEPMLYKNPILPYDFTSWVSGHIWLHKQPLFLWQMAISMKIFGVNTLALRLPSMLMSTIIIYFIYRIGKISINKTVGFYGALLFALSNFSLEVAAGTIHTDHNDVAFLFYVCASVWAWVEYENTTLNKKKYYLLLIGIFAGCAILVKWLTGLLVFSGWGLSILFSKERRKQKILYIHLLITFLIAVLLFLPWQVYILNTFPQLSNHEFALNSRHFFEVIEGHGGNFWWHFNIAHEIYGVSIYFLLFCVIIFSLSIKKSIFKHAFIVYIFVIYLFFGVAATKMIAFTYSISFLIYLSIAATIAKFFEVIILNPEYSNKKIYQITYTTIIIGVISGINLNIEKIQENHTMWKKDETSFFAIRTKALPVIKSLSKKINGIEEYVIFNCRKDDHIQVMFFNEVLAAYSFIPDDNIINELKQKGHKIAIFDNGNLQDYLLKDNSIVKIKGYW